MALSFLSFLAVYIASGSSQDLLGFLEPKMALECLGEKTDDDALRAFIEGVAAAEGPAPKETALDEKAVTRAVQNLASSSESVREEAHRKLVEMGAAVRGRLEEVVAKDPKRAEAAKKVLSDLGAGAKASAHRKEVARILAVRLAADRKLEKLAPAIRGLVESPSPFLRRAARDALARLEPKPGPGSTAAAVVESRPWADSLAALEALPQATRILAQLRMIPFLSPAPQKPEGLRIDAFLKGFLAQMQEAGMPTGNAEGQLEQMIRQGTQAIVEIVASYGNARLDRIAVANVGGISEMGAGLGVILTGEYERDVLEKGLEANSQFWTVSETGGKKVFTSMFVRVIPLDDHTVLVLPQQASINFPLDEFLANLKAGKKALRGDKRWGAFLGTLGGDSAFRGLAITDKELLSELYKEMDRENELTQEAKDAIKGMKTLELDARLRGGEKFAYKVDAEFETDKHAAGLASFVKEKLQQAVEEGERAVATFGDQPPAKFMRKALDVVKGIQVGAEGKKGTIQAEFDLSFLSMGFFGIRSAPVGAPVDFVPVEEAGG